MKNHPIQSVLFATIFASLATFLSFREDLLLGGGIVYFAFALLCGFLIWRYQKTLLVFTLACLLVLPSQAQLAPEEQETAESASPECSAGAAVVVVVIVVVWGIIIYKLAKFCQKHFPKNPPPPSKPTNTIPSSLSYFGSDAYVSAYNLDYLGSCWEDDPCNDMAIPDGQDENDSVTTYLTISVNQNNEGKVVLSGIVEAKKGTNYVQSWAEFQAECLEQNVILTGEPGTSYHSYGGDSIAQEDSPVLYDAERKVIKVGIGSPVYYGVVVQRSKDMRNWVDLLKTEVEIGRTIQIQDTTPTGQEFYRYWSYGLAD